MQANKKRLSLVAVILSSLLLIAGCSKSDSNSGSGDSGGGSVAVTKILAIGDSIGTTEFSSRSPWPQRIGGSTNVQVVNNSRSGRRTSEIVGAIPGLLDREQPSHLVVLLGTNDARIGAVGAAVSNLQAMVDAARARGVVPVIGTLPPIFQSSQQNRSASSISGGIRNLNNAVIAEVRGALGNNSSQFPDGLHPNDAGSAIIASAFVSVF